MCRLAIVYKDEASRNHAMEVVKGLLAQFRGELLFESTWWGFKYLGNAEISRQAAAAAAAADLILIAIPSGQAIPLDIKRWLERWSADCPPAEAALILLEAPTIPSGHVWSEAPYIQGLAERAGLDYIAASRETKVATPHPSVDWASRSGRRGWTGPLEDGYRSSCWGINE